MSSFCAAVCKSLDLLAGKGEVLQLKRDARPHHGISRPTLETCNLNNLILCYNLFLNKVTTKEKQIVKISTVTRNELDAVNM